MGLFNLKKQRPLEEREDLEKQLYSILEFLANIGRDIKDVYDLGKDAKKSRSKERSEIDNKKQLKLLEKEIKDWDLFLERYVMLQRDVAVTGQRVKKISKILQEEAAKMPIGKDLKLMVKRKDEWVFNW